MANRIFSIKFIKPINYLILLLLISFSFLLNTDEFYIIDYIIDGDVYNLSDLQGEINDNPMIIKLFLIINNISILFFLLGRKFIGIFCFILTAYFFVHLIGDLDLLFHIIYSVETSSVVYSISRRILKHEHAQKHPPHPAPPTSHLAGLHAGEGKRHLSGTPLPSQPRHHLPRP